VSGNRPAGGLGELIGTLTTDIQDLVRGEIKLARAELDEKLNRVLMAAIWLIGGALVAFAGLSCRGSRPLSRLSCRPGRHPC
jgi:hypothetical protein